MKREWIRTDDLQWVSVINKDQGLFFVVDVTEIPSDLEVDHKYAIVALPVDVNNLLETERDYVESIINAYGYTLKIKRKNYENVFDFYGDDAKQVIAECVTEMNFDDLWGYAVDDENLKAILKIDFDIEGEV